MDEAPITVFMQRGQTPLVDRLDSKGEWRGEVAWPVAGASEQTIALRPGRFTYRSTFGASTGGLWSGGLTFGLAGDQRADDGYALVTRGEPLERPLAILGQARVELRFVANAPGRRGGRAGSATSRLTVRPSWWPRAS